VCSDDESARRALLAIYQAGKPDMMFHSRAPCSAALEKMLRAVSDANVREPRGVTRNCDSPSSRRDADSGHRFTAGRDVSDDDQRVKVKVECPPLTDTVFTFRVQSKAAEHKVTFI